MNFWPFTIQWVLFVTVDKMSLSGIKLIFDLSLFPVLLFYFLSLPWCHFLHLFFAFAMTNGAVDGMIKGKRVEVGEGFTFLSQMVDVFCSSHKKAAYFRCCSCVCEIFKCAPCVFQTSCWYRTASESCNSWDAHEHERQREGGADHKRTQLLSVKKSHSGEASLRVAASIVIQI